MGPLNPIPVTLLPVLPLLLLSLRFLLLLLPPAFSSSDLPQQFLTLSPARTALRLLPLASGTPAEFLFLSQVASHSSFSGWSSSDLFICRPH